ncbi:MAG: hypothetical protein DRJ47_08575 [Thermoprotei archaeon]|nr:MAG: hypothetical protein DRJ47_08575 [Thermoprotei archaeon]
MEVKLPDFYNALNITLMYYDVSTLTPHPSHLARAWMLRRKYNLTFFDSLHAATAIEEDEPIVSYDKRYSDIKDLRYVDPRTIL